MINVKVSKLKNDISKYKKVLMYGTGFLARELYQVFKDKGISVDYFVVTKKTDECFCNIPVYEYGEKTEELRSSESIVIIAVTEKYENEIERILIDGRTYCYLKASEYIRNVGIYKRYKDKNKEEYLWEIAEWLVDKGNGAYREIENVKRELEIKSSGRTPDPKSIIFTVLFESARVRKMAGLLREHGYAVQVLDLSCIYVTDKNNIKIMESVRPFCSDYHKCECIEDVMAHLIDSNGFVNHVFNIEDSAIAYSLIRMKALFPPLVYEQYDIFNGMYKTPYQEPYLEICRLERLCLENADGICNRGYELEYITKELGFKINGKVTRFLDYCNRYTAQQTADEKELTLCYMGGVNVVNPNKKNRHYCFEELAELCKKNHCHLHMYPITNSEEVYDHYMQIEQNNAFFHVHELVDYELITEEISQYDYGIWPVKGSVGEDEDEVYTKRKFIYSATNKYFSFIEAGLPFITAGPKIFLELFKEHNMVIPWTIEEYDFDELRRRRREMKDNVVRNRKYLDIGNHFESLIEFYKSL